MHTGVIKKFMEDRGYGFIRPDGGGEDVFMHVSILSQGVRPAEGMRVEYDLADDPLSGRQRAANVRVVP